MESYISLGGTMFYSLFAQKYIFGWRYSIVQKGIQQNQNNPMETTN